MSKSYKVKKSSKGLVGFSLVELLLVVTIAGIISAIAIPFLVKAVGATENAGGYASLKVVSSTQVAFYSRNNRFGRLDEINTESNDTLGTIEGSNLRRGVFTYTMSPVVPSDAELRDEFEIIATKRRTLSDTPCVMSLTSTGVVTEIFGTNCIEAE